MRQGRDRLSNTTKLRPYVAVVKLSSCPCGLPSVLDAQRHFGTSSTLPRELNMQLGLASMKIQDWFEPFNDASVPPHVL
jgi:hypothetical protein